MVMFLVLDVCTLSRCGNNLRSRTPPFPFWTWKRIKVLCKLVRIDGIYSHAIFPGLSAWKSIELYAERKAGRDVSVQCSLEFYQVNLVSRHSDWKRHLLCVNK